MSLNITFIPRDGQRVGLHVARHGHDMCPYSTARHACGLGWVGLRILGTWVLKARYD